MIQFRITELPIPMIHTTNWTTSSLYASYIFFLKLIITFISPVLAGFMFYFTSEFLYFTPSPVEHRHFMFSPSIGTACFNIHSTIIINGDRRQIDTNAWHRRDGPEPVCHVHQSSLVINCPDKKRRMFILWCVLKNDAIRSCTKLTSYVNDADQQFCISCCNFLHSLPQDEYFS